VNRAAGEMHLFSDSRCFAPLSHPSARVLILGSLPGRCSLAQGRYYAQAQNSFWRLMGDLFDAGPQLAYEERTQRLLMRDVAVWDVCASAQRAGSLDAAIVRTSVASNDFGAFFAAHRGIRLIGFNGKTAADLYERHVQKRLTPRAAGIPRVCLPSTSPAHAAMSYGAKLDAWRTLSIQGRA
jgi:hypoxanthine-DNA glycosylase